VAKRYVNLKHLEYVRSKPCYICGSMGDIEAHHLLKPWRGGRGMSLKAGDENSIPLCFNHHRELHQTGNEEKFFLKKNGSGDDGKFYARLLWLRSPHYERIINV
jgi:hypothetical protein